MVTELKRSTGKHSLYPVAEQVHTFTFDSLSLQLGDHFDPVTLAYETWGTLNAAGDTVLRHHTLLCDLLEQPGRLLWKYGAILAESTDRVALRPCIPVITIRDMLDAQRKMVEHLQRSSQRLSHENLF